MATTATPSVKFYTNLGCPWAQRAQITLKELNIPYEEVLIDLDVPREEWYLKINPRGLVPSIEYSGDGVNKEIIYESAVVSQFLADAHPSHLTAPSGEQGAQAALFRARIAFFVDTFIGKVNSQMYTVLKAEGEAQEKGAQDLLASIKKELEPLLADAAPFFGGSKKLTLAEVLTAPFILRYISYSKAGLFPASLKEGIEALPNFGKWAKAVIAEDSVRFNYDEEAIITRSRARIAKMKAAAK